MSSYDRVMVSLNHQNPDRPPLDFAATEEVVKRLMKCLNISDYYGLLEFLGVDLWHFAPKYIGPKQFTETNFMGVKNIKKDYFGILWKPVMTKFAKYYEIEAHPLIKMKVVDDIENYSWPNPDWFDASYIKEEIKKMGGSGKKAIVLYAGGAFEIAWYMRGMEQLFYDLICNPQIAEIIFKKLTDFFKNRTLRAIEILKGKVDIIYSDGDIGTQNGMMISPAIWRKYVKPWSEELIKPFKKMGFKTMYHSCGSIIPVINDFIEMGLDILDPIQTRAKGMSPEYLKEQFGGRISFHGGVDEQRLLPYGKDSEVENEVSRLIDVLGKNGGYILSSSHAIQADTPVENILAMYRAAKKIILDGEGASKFIEIEILNARSRDEAKVIGLKIANSLLFKASIFGESINWGRIASAIGSLNIKFDTNKVDLYMNDFIIFHNGMEVSDNMEPALLTMQNKNIKVKVDMNCGKVSSKIWTTDLTHDFVKASSHYRS